MLNKYSSSMKASSQKGFEFSQPLLLLGLILF